MTDQRTCLECRHLSLFKREPREADAILWCEKSVWEGHSFDDVESAINTARTCEHFEEEES